jgi:hypothetical protein
MDMSGRGGERRSGSHAGEIGGRRLSPGTAVALRGRRTRAAVVHETWFGAMHTVHKYLGRLSPGTAVALRGRRTRAAVCF